MPLLWLNDLWKMDLPIHYGDSQVVLRIPPDNIVDVIRPRQMKDLCQSNVTVIDQALATNSLAFSQATKGRTLGVLLPDGTRDIPLATILPQVFRLFRSVKKVLFFICTGTHETDTPENQKIIELIQTEAININLQEYEIVTHDCRSSGYVLAGTTERGTEILYNAHLQEPMVFLVLSDVKHHYFAGYSNPIKNFVPGLCAFKTTEQNHSLTMDERSCAGVHPWHPDPGLRDNSLAQDQAEAMGAIIGWRSVWAIVTLSTEGNIQWADFGLMQQVTSQAFLKADEWNCFSIKSVRKMIISPGGLPNDVDLYIAQRALELAADVVCDGGEILFLCACPKGVGNIRTKNQFYDKLITPLDEIVASSRCDYRLFSHKPWRFARLIQRLNRLWMYSQIGATEIKKMHMTPTNDPQNIIDAWFDQNPQEKVLIVDGASKLLLRQQQ